jgi:hypothetical protein
MTRRLLLAWGLGLAAGCAPSATAPEGKPEDPAATELREVFELVSLATAEGGKPPKGVKDLAKYESAYPLGFDRLRAGKLVAVWGVGPDPASAGLLAHEKDAAAAGGWVVRRNGQVEKLTADQVRAAGG